MMSPFLPRLLAAFGRILADCAAYALCSLTFGIITFLMFMEATR